MRDGFVIIDKPSGLTSHDVVNLVRRRFKMRQVGHAGTLDPLATGVLIVLLGQSTKLFNTFADFDKAYNATLKLGIRTNTADIEGHILSSIPCLDITKDHLEEVFSRFKGDIKQTPPMVSAIKVNGIRLYKLARSGIKIEREPREIRIDVLKVIDFNGPDVRFYLECSKGTYVRQLAEDIGNILGCGACITQIQRTKVGPFIIDQAVKVEDLDENHIRTW